MARKSKQKTEELRGLEDADLMKELEDAHRQLFTVRLQLMTRQQSNTSEPRKLRRKIARIKTLIHERALSAAQQAAGTRV